MNNKIRSLETELKKLQKLREQERKKKELKTKIWVLKHPRLVSAGEKTRSGLGKISVGIKSSFKKMREKEERQKKQYPNLSKETYAERLNKSLENLSK